MKHSQDIDSLIEVATVDCYDQEECRIGFLTLIQDNLQTPFEATLKGRKITVVDIDGDDRVIKAQIKDGEAIYPVDILDLTIEEKLPGSEWVAAYRKWEE